MHVGEWFVLLGRKVARAFECQDRTAFSLDPERRVVLLPHPSGRCLAGNDPENVERARSLVGSIARYEVR
jgi:hypothetical protein